MKRSFGIIALTVAALLAVTLLAFHLHQRSKEEVVSGFQEQQFLMARQVANQVESYLRDRSQRVRLLSTLASSQPLELERLKGNIDSYFQYVKTKSVRAITVYDESGKIIYSASKSPVAVKDAPPGLFVWARKPENRGKVSISPIVIPAVTGERLPSCALLLFESIRFETYPPGDPGISPKLGGGISLTVDMKELLSGQLALVSPKRKAPQAWIIDESGTLLFHSEHPEMVLRSVRHRDAQCEQCHFSMNYVEKILKEKRGIVDYAVGDSSKKLAAFAPIEFEDAKWVLVVNAPYDDVTAFVRRSFRDTLMLLVVTVLALVTGSSLVYQDYRSRVRAEEEALQWREKTALEGKVRESEERYRRLVELSPDTIFIQNEGRIVYINAAGLKLFRAKNPEELLGRDVLDFVHPDFHSSVRERIQLVKEGIEIPRLEEKYLRVDGDPVDVEVMATPFRFDDKPAAQVIVRDITERKRAEEAVLKRSRQLQILSRATQEVNAVLEVPSIMRSLIASAMELVGATGGTAGIMACGRLEFTEYNQNGTLIPIEYRFESGVGVPGWVLENRKPYISNNAERDPQVIPEIQKALGFYNLINVPINNRRGELLGVFEIHNTLGRRPFDEIDVELLQGLAASAAGALENAQILIERSQAEMETARQKTLLQQLFENAPAAIALLDANDRILQVNKGFETTFQFSSHEVVGKPINETVVSEEFSDEASLLSSRVLHGETVEVQSTRRRKDGTLVPVQIYGVPIVINQRQTGIYGMYVDLSESKRLEDQFRQAQKMEAVGRLAGGVAHDFNNLLTAIMGYSDLLLMRLDGPDPIRKNVEEIKKAGERAASLTRQLLAFSRRQVLQPQVMDLNTVVSGMEKLVRRLIGEDIDLRLRLQSPLGSVKADPGQIEQVILNLVINSRDAMPHGGKLTIETKSIVLQEEYIWKDPGAKPGAHVVLEVRDTGTGMSTEVQSHLFEPFFTTKEKGKGTGLGLSTVYGIVKQSNGFISAYSEEGRGTTFKVYLPLVDVLVANARPPAEPEKWVAGSETILLVEDEKAIRGLMQAVLRMKGYTVLEASDGQEALGMFKGNGDHIDLVITDVVMPRMSGRELASRIVADQPGTKVLYVSGYSEEAVLYQGNFQQGTAFLQKPFTPDSLTRKVREMLDQ